MATRKLYRSKLLNPQESVHLLLSDSFCKMCLFLGLVTLSGILGTVLGETNSSYGRLHQPMEYVVPPGYRKWDDMILPESFFDLSKNDSRNAVNSRDLIWPYGRIPVVIHNSLHHARSKIVDAMDEYHSKTCVRFVPREQNDLNYVLMFDGSGCHSMIGNQRYGQQDLSLGSGCLDHGTIVHELGHAVGFHHEQNRSDRDDYIVINWNNIDPAYHDQFAKLNPSQNWLINEFNVDSIMMYGDTAFSYDSYSPTMQQRGGRRLVEVYQKYGLTYSDVERINRLYGC